MTYGVNQQVLGLCFLMECTGADLSIPGYIRFWGDQPGASMPLASGNPKSYLSLIVFVRYFELRLTCLVHRAL